MKLNELFGIVRVRRVPDQMGLILSSSNLDGISLREM